MAKIKIN